MQKEMAQGQTIADTCRKHNINFKTLCDTCKGYIRTKNKTGRQKSYILQKGERYAIRKTIKGKIRMFGTYNSYDDAIRMVEALQEDGWHQTHVDQLCDELGIQRRKGFINEKVRYH